ncbi:hypothetical protein JXR93_09410, partial [bacterium]|nr:hypothetical protein [bacterium]
MIFIFFLITLFNPDIIDIKNLKIRSTEANIYQYNIDFDEYVYNILKEYDYNPYEKYFGFNYFYSNSTKNYNYLYSIKNISLDAVDYPTIYDSEFKISKNFSENIINNFIKNKDYIESSNNDYKNSFFSV